MAAFLEYFPASGATRRALLEPLPFTIGRSSKSHLILDDDTVSKSHAEIFHVGSQLVIRDLNSTNGICVNHRRIKEAPLEHNDIIHVAHEELRFLRAANDEEKIFSDPGVTKASQDKTPRSVCLGRQCLHEILAERRVRVLFQRIVDLESGETVAQEALGRGTHSDLSIMPTELFVLAERFDLAAELSQLFRDTAVSAAAQLPHGQCLFLNVHPSEMKDGSFVDSLRCIRAHHSQRQLVLEISENAVADRSAWSALYRDLKDTGIQVAFDDFGSGQARLLELTEFPPHYLKLDMRLVRDIHRSPARQNLVQALTHSTADLGIKVIAEGVETEEEAATCRRLGCHLGQGFFFARPQGIPLPASSDDALEPMQQVTVKSYPSAQDNFTAAPISPSRPG